MNRLVVRLTVAQLLLYSLHCALVVHASVDHTLRLLVIDYVADYLKIPANYDADLATTSNFLLAAKHINERRSDILPALALPNCPVNVSVVAFVDDGGFAARTMFAMNQYNADVDAVVGISWSPVATHAGFLSTALSLPIVSNWASAPILNDRTNYPYFARTIPDDGVIAVKVVSLLNQWGYRKFGLLYDEGQSATKDVYLTESAQLGMNLSAFAVTEGAADSTLDAVVAIANLNLNILVIHCTFSLLRTSLDQALADNGYLEDDKLILFTDFDRPPTESDFANDPLMKQLFRGAFRVESGSQDPTHFNAYLQRWDTEFASAAYVSYLNSFLPPNGNASNLDLGALDLSNWGYVMNISGPDFFSRTKSTAYPAWGMAYDVVVALALAKCEMILSGNTSFSRVELLNKMEKTDFEGLSGNVRFKSDGDRDSTSLAYLVRNWDLNNVVETVGKYNDQLEEFVFTAPLQFRQGSMPPEITPPEEIKQHLPIGWKILGYIEISILNLFALACISWAYWYRKHKAVFHAQRTFLNLIALGCMLASFSILAFSVDDDDNGLDTNICMLGPWLFTIGMMLAITSLLAKMIRILSVFNAPVGSTARALVRRPVAISGIAFVLVVEIALLTAWTVANPLVWKRIVTVIDKNGFALLSYGACTPQDQSNFGTGFGFLITLILMHFIILLLLGALNIKMKGFPEEFQENKYVTLLFAVLIQLDILAVPVFIAVVSNPIGRFLVISTFVFCSCFALLFFIFVPKMEQVRKNLMFRHWQATHAKHYEGTSTGTEHNGFAGEVDFEEGIRNGYIREKFRKFAENNFVIESFYFYMDAEQFKAKPLTPEGTLDMQKAKDIYEIYIREGGLLQINISSKLRDQVTVAYNTFVTGKSSVANTSETSSAVDKAQTLITEFASIFVPAQTEIVDLLNNGAWRAFVDEGGMYRPPSFMTQESAPSPARTSRRVAQDAGADTTGALPLQGVRSLFRLRSNGKPSDQEPAQPAVPRNHGNGLGRSGETRAESGATLTTV